MADLKDAVRVAFRTMLADLRGLHRSPTAAEGAWVALARLIYPEREIQRALTRAWRPAGLEITDPDLIGWKTMKEILTDALADLESTRG